MQRLLSSLQKMSRGGIAGLIAVFGIAGVVLFFVAARWVNTAPSRCATCHPQLTAMWERSHGHPGGRVSCYECHAGHAEAPASLNVGAVIRDQLIPEKYLSSDARVESRCEGCHEGVRTSGTGRDLIDGKEKMKGVANRLSSGALAGRRVPVPAELLADDTSGRALLGEAIRQLRNSEWRAAFAEAGGGNAAELRKPLEFSGQSLKWARVSETKVKAGVSARVRSRLTLYKGGLGKVRRGLEELTTLFPAEPPEGTEPDAAVVEQAREVLEGMSRGLKAAARARTALVRELGGLEDAIFNPDGLAKALRSVPRAMKRAQWEKVVSGLAAGQEALSAAGTGFDQAAIDTRAEKRSEELTQVLQAKLTGLKEAFSSVLGDLPGEESTGAATQAELAGAVMEAGDLRLEGEPAKASQDPRGVVAAAATAVRSLEVSLEAASNLGWSDFSLREEQVKAMAERFEALEAAFKAQEESGLEGPLVRQGMEQALVSLVAAEAADGLYLVYRVVGANGDGPVTVSLDQLVGHATDALLALEAGLEQRSVIKANHKVHFQLESDPFSGRAVELGCLDCHRNIAHDKALVETFRPPMASCFVGGCHRKDRNKDNCRRCHYQQLSELTAAQTD